jgi:amino acid transporter
LFFAKSYDLSFSRFRRLFSSSTRASSPSERTPVPALFLHWFFTTVLVITTTVIFRDHEPGKQSYIFIVAIYAYVLDVIFFVLVGAAMLYLRLAPRSKWHLKSESNHWISIAASIVFGAACLFPLIFMWIPDSDNKTLTSLTNIPWFVGQTVCVAILGISVLYWFGFRYVVPHVGKHRGMEFIIVRNPRFHEEHGYPVQTFEEIAADWKLPDASVPDDKLMELSAQFKRDIDG